ncbi:MAG: vWA domain-containing protein [Polyangiaceae bacterium]
MRTILALLGCSMSLSLVACGGSEDISLFPDTPPAKSGAGTGSDGNGFGEDMQSGTNSACVSSVAEAALQPANLVFMYDKSGSMGDPKTGFDPAKRWLPVNSGMRQFFTAAGSKSLNASLQFFPSDGDLEAVCAYPYATPKVALSPLADSSPFLAAIDAETPSGGTPTVPALQGAVTYAKQIKTNRPGQNVAIVLVTDGEPGFWNDSSKSVEPGCSGNTVAEASSVAADAFAAGIPVHVIGVGPSLANLNAVASSGGTNAAQMIDVGDPGQTTATFLSSLNAIRKQAVSCNFSIPPAPEGKQLDFNAVNVVLTDTNGKENVLYYSKDCSRADGWHYDNAAAPTEILLCTNACSTAQSAANAKVAVALGCKTQAQTK